ncbi:unnamed protein product [Thelazia callipaeda]|uniref:Uncharacterized protein n=1 Tax=Thelazia callipaeda TaxID=103827 RepID=A0A0N5CUF3_THECL|nr:unnamed protein product [Thelazia callipaeda]
MKISKKNTSQSIEIVDKHEGMKEFKNNEICMKKKAKKPPLSSIPQKIDAFKNVDFWLSKNSNTEQSKSFSSGDSGISSCPVSRANTNDTLSECCTEEFRAFQNSHQRPSRFQERCTSNECESEEGKQNAVHSSRESARTRHRCSKSYRRSVRHDLSITRHIVRVRNEQNKRAQSVMAAIRLKQPESQAKSENSKKNSTFYEDYQDFY